MTQNSDIFSHFKSNVITYQNDDQWKKIRMTGIGGSDIAGICGQSRWNSPLNVYLSKIDERYDTLKDLPQDKINEMKENMWWGTHLEPTISKAFEQKHDLRTISAGCIFQSKEYPWALATIDRYIIHDSVLEIKTISYDVKKSNAPQEDGILNSYILQLQWYLFVCGFQYGWLAILDTSQGKHRLITKRIERDDEIINYLITIAKRFWNENVCKKIPPTPKDCNYSDEILEYFYPKATNKEAMNLNEESENLLKDYVKGQELEKEGKKLQEESGNRIKSILGEHELGITPVGHKIFWKNFSTKRLQQALIKSNYPEIYENCSQTTESRRFTISLQK